jgi:predicted metalloendopeptidase
MMLRKCVGLCCLLSGLLITPLALADSGLDAATFDKSVRVQDDLYLAVNGRWLAETDIPSDKSNYGSFTVLADQAQQRLRDIIEAAAAGEHPQGSDEQKVGDFYKSFMDEQRVEALGITPILDELAKVDALATHGDVVKHFGYSQKFGVASPVAMFVTQDAKDSTRYIVSVVQSGTSLPDRDYYLEEDDRYLDAQAALKQYIETLFRLAKLPADGVADAILDVETKFAKAQWPRVKLRDAEERYNLFSFEELCESAVNLSPQDFFAAADVPAPGDVNVMTPSFFEELELLLPQTSMETWKNYLRFHLIDAAAPYLSQAFADAHFNFHQQALAGVPEQKPRWKRAVDAVAGAGAGDFGALGEVVGRLYVQQYFKPDAKQRMEQLVENLLKAYEGSIDSLTWMTDTTKAKAQEKLAKFTTKIGYPNKWRDYSKLTVDPQDLLGNAKRAAAVEYQRMIDKLGKPIDREEWGMTPQTVNAYYNPGKNEIVFPAAILQPPFFNMESDDAVNYGAIGAVIGHEISHGFDDQGSKYDGDGNLKNWWTAKDREQFKQLTQRLVDQYNEYAPLPGKNVNGEFTLGENIADLSGLSIAHKAYTISLAGQDAPVIDGWTGDQRFFMGWSQVWRRKYRDAEMIRRLKTDPHAPSWYRANGPVINIDAFYSAFNVQPEDALFRAREDRIYIW